MLFKIVLARLLGKLTYIFGLKTIATSSLCACAHAHKWRFRSLPSFQKKRGAEDGGGKVEAERSLQMRIFLPAGEQVHQGGSAVSETD